MIDLPDWGLPGIKPDAPERNTYSLRAKENRKSCIFVWFQKLFCMKTTTIWKGGKAYDSFQNNAKVSLDSGVGFGPKALLLTGLAGCSGIDVVEILEKMRVPFASLEIDAEAEQTEEHPRVFKTIHLTYKFKAEESQREKIKKAIDLSLEKYCGVAAMLKKNGDIHYEIIISE
jgi:putative redox protein